ncbi:hypothetical protein [Roseiconus lacunae]|uniref:hypothetical protein n=1 Tax=Roseiconus lacunae TaxID=2605694 RepID=UPI001E4C7083|nr:hypothetical protein [Roseiconus lacunae]MCD0463626.1 hypothetical protein [Roseiconus lacunae]
MKGISSVKQSMDNQHPRHRLLSRRLMLGSIATSAIGISGCPLSMPQTLPGDASEDEQTVSVGSDDRELATLVRDTLDYEKNSRGLSVSINGAWQIFHGILAYGSEFLIDTPSGLQSAVEYFKAGGVCDGFRPRLGDRFDDGEYGFKVDMQASTKVGQGHRDQWLAVVAQAGQQRNDQWKIDETTLTIENWLRQAEFDVPLNYEAEFSWTLIPLSFYRPSDYRWTARDGETYSTELLVESEVLRDLAASVCGGTHRLIGIAYALRNRVTEGSAVTGIWSQAKDHLAAAIEMARVNQNPDGTYSTAYLHRTGWCSDLGESLGTTGHVLETIAVAGDDETLRADWVRRSVVKLCEILELCRGVDLECGVLYHALHGLLEYQRRIASA